MSKVALVDAVCSEQTIQKRINKLNNRIKEKAG